MLLTPDTLSGIERGVVSLAFRRWRRPTVKAGGTLLTAIGQLAIESVDVVDLDDVTEADARAAGFTDLASLRAFLAERGDGDVYRIRLSLLGPDPRVALRTAIPDDLEVERLVTRLRRLDAAADAGPWTRRVLELIRDRPGERAASLADVCGMERMVFKARVRKLKNLGLTESLVVGYRIAPRGRALLDALARAGAGRR